MHSVGARNLDALWNKALTQGSFAPDEATAIAQGQSATGIAVTSVVCAKDEDQKTDYAPLHVIRNQKKGTTLIVGNAAIPDDLYNRLKRGNITYINKEHFSARDRLNTELREMIPAPQIEDVRSAFLLRNELVTGNAQDAMVRLLVIDESKVTNPNFITTLEPESIKHSERAAQSAVKSRLLGRMTGK